jgi:hypothetical protein
MLGPIKTDLEARVPHAALLVTAGERCVAVRSHPETRGLYLSILVVRQEL